jgi:hypothetical protein
MITRRAILLTLYERPGFVDFDFGDIGLGWCVRVGDEYTDGLCWDEMLGQIVSLTHPDIEQPRYGMLTAEGWQQRRRDQDRRHVESRRAENWEVDPR